MLNTHVKLAPACCFGDEAGVGNFEQADQFKFFAQKLRSGGGGGGRLQAPEG